MAVLRIPMKKEQTARKEGEASKGSEQYLAVR